MIDLICFVDYIIGIHFITRIEDDETMRGSGGCGEPGADVRGRSWPLVVATARAGRWTGDRQTATASGAGRHVTVGFSHPVRPFRRSPAGWVRRPWRPQGSLVLYGSLSLSFSVSIYVFTYLLIMQNGAGDRFGFDHHGHGIRWIVAGAVNVGHRDHLVEGGGGRRNGQRVRAARDVADGHRVGAIGGIGDAPRRVTGELDRDGRGFAPADGRDGVEAGGGQRIKHDDHADLEVHAAAIAPGCGDFVEIGSRVDPHDADLRAGIGAGEVGIGGRAVAGGGGEVEATHIFIEFPGVRISGNRHHAERMLQTRAYLYLRRCGSNSQPCHCEEQHQADRYVFKPGQIMAFSV